MAVLALTGAAGRIATALRPRLRRAGHHLVLLEGVGVAVADIDPAVERVVECDLQDVDGQAEAFAGADLVVHLGAYSDERAWADLLAVNIDGTRAVCEAARLAGVRRMLLASSVHAAGYVPVDSEAARTGMPLPAPDTYYGVSKAALEALGALYANRYAMTVVSARIMTFGDDPTGPPSLRSWLSGDDMTRLVEAALSTGATGHHVVWGVSRNARRRVDLAPGLVIGFDPQDDAETSATEAQRRDVATERGEVGGVLGGTFATTDLGLGESRRG